MKTKGFTIGLLSVVVMFMTTTESDAQLVRSLKSRVSSHFAPIYNGVDGDGMVMSDYTGFVLPQNTLKMAAQNHFSPEPIYTYSNPGIKAQRTHHWNQNEAMGRSWHDNYSNWRWEQPTALVVPPTAAYETSYSWGVGQVRSTPIHSQFGRQGAGMIGGGMGAQRTPYWPSTTRQFGIYPVRAPW
jgi:hypothetical protein